MDRVDLLSDLFRLKSKISSSGRVWVSSEIFLFTECRRCLLLASVMSAELLSFAKLFMVSRYFLPCVDCICVCGVEQEMRKLCVKLQMMAPDVGLSQIMSSVNEYHCLWAIYQIHYSLFLGPMVYGHQEGRSYHTWRHLELWKKYIFTVTIVQKNLFFTDS